MWNFSPKLGCQMWQSQIKRSITRGISTLGIKIASRDFAPHGSCLEFPRMKMIHRIVKFLCFMVGVNVTPYSLLIKRINKWFIARGPVYVADRVKSIRLACLRYWAGVPFKTYPGISLDPLGLPRSIPWAIRKEITVAQSLFVLWSILLSVLSILRLLKGGKEVDYLLILNPNNTSEDDKHTILRELKASIKSWKYSQNKVVPWPWHFRLESDPSRPVHKWILSAGPFGPMNTKQAVYLAKEILHDMFIHIMNVNPTVGKWLYQLRIIIDQSPKTWGLISSNLGFPFRSELDLNTPCFRRLSVKADYETKSRVFCIGDYWTQISLQPMHDLFFNLLKKIPGDCLFNQEASETLSNLDKGGHSYHSLDLSAATDRFPMWFQLAIVEHFIGSLRAHSWEALMVHYTVKLPSGGKVIYQCGQPIGMLSSWAAFLVAHHLVVQIAARRAGFKIWDFDSYRVLGDDVVICHDEVAFHYTAIMTLLGVEISPIKTHVSPHSYELAKRWFYDGVEFLPFPIHAIIELAYSPSLLFLALSQAAKHGWGQVLNIDSRCPESLVQLLHAMGFPLGKTRWYALRLAMLHFYDSILNALDLSLVHSSVDAIIENYVIPAGWIDSKLVPLSVIAELIGNLIYDHVLTLYELAWFKSVQSGAEFSAQVIDGVEPVYNLEGGSDSNLIHDVALMVPAVNAVNYFCDALEITDIQSGFQDLVPGTDSVFHWIVDANQSKLRDLPSLVFQRQRPLSAFQKRMLGKGVKVTQFYKELKLSLIQSESLSMIHDEKSHPLA